MSAYTEPQHESVTEQLTFIESMIREGRKSTEYWGWCFVLWGVAYLVATAWATIVNSAGAFWAWPVTMTIAGAATGLIAHRRNLGEPVTTRSRAIGGIWMAVGFGIILFAFPQIIAHRYGDGHIFFAGIEMLLGVAQIASGRVLRWNLQIGIGLLWWTAALITTFTRTDAGVTVPFLSATFVCHIGFGAYLMYCEARDKAKLRAGQVIHA